MYTITDDFSHIIEFEPNGKLWNNSNWTFYANGGSMTPFVYNGKLRLSTVLGTGSSSVYSNVFFRPFTDPDNVLGNFQITIDFSEAYFETRTGFCMRYDKGTDGKVQLQRECTSTDVQRIMAMNQNYGESAEYSTYNTDAVSGKLRIRRSGNVMYCYYDVGAGWVELSSKVFTPRPTDGTIQLYCYSYTDGGESGCIHIDNFTYEAENQILYTISGTVTPADDKIIYLVKDWTGYPEILEHTQASAATGEFSFDNIWTNSETFDVIGKGDTGEQDIIYNSVTPVNMGLPDERPGDPDSYTVLLLHSDDANNSTTIIDSSQSNHTIINNGGVHRTARKKFGNSSIHILHDENYMYCAASTDWALGHAYTIDLWFNTVTSYGFGPFVGQTYGYYHWRLDASNSHFAWAFEDEHGSIYNNYEPGGYIFSPNNWYHVAVTYDGYKNRLYINGNFVQGLVTNHTVPYWNVNMRITGGGWEEGGKYFDELRISKGIARWTTETSFTPPTAPYWYTCF